MLEYAFWIYHWLFCTYFERVLVSKALNPIYGSYFGIIFQKVLTFMHPIASCCEILISDIVATLPGLTAASCHCIHTSGLCPVGLRSPYVPSPQFPIFSLRVEKLTDDYVRIALRLLRLPDLLPAKSLLHSVMESRRGEVEGGVCGTNIPARALAWLQPSQLPLDWPYQCLPHPFSIMGCTNTTTREMSDKEGSPSAALTFQSNFMLLLVSSQYQLSRSHLSKGHVAFNNSNI